MKTISHIGILVASLALCLAAVLFIQFNESQKWAINANQSHDPKQIIYINTNDDPKSQLKVVNAIETVTKQYHLGVIRIDDQVNQSGSYLIGVYDPGNQIKFLDKYTDIVNAGFSKPDSNHTWSTQLLDTKHTRLFNLLKSSNVTVVSVESLLNRSQTVNGTYQFFGEDQVVSQSLLRDLATKTGISQKDLTTQHAFKHHSISMYFNLTILLVALLSVIIIVTGLFSIYHTGEMIGTKKLLGYSNWSIIENDFVTISLVIVLSIMFEIIIVNCFLEPVALTVYPVLLLFQVPLVVVIIISFLLQYNMITHQKLSAFIKGQKKATFMLVIIFIVFIMTTILTAYTLKVIDYQASQLYLNNRKMQHWHKKDNYQILSEMSTGKDSASFTYQSVKLSHDFKNFYSKIADNSGIMWAASSSFDNDKQQQKDIYNFWNLPNVPSFSLMQLSPSAIIKQHLTDENGNLINIKNSDFHRYYILPKKYHQNLDYQKFFNHFPILGSSVNPKNKQTVNQFIADQHVKILYYITPNHFSSWDDSNRDILYQPVIEVITSRNMTDIDASHLMTIGIENPLRLNNHVAKTNAFQKAVADSNLADNHLVFSSIKDTLSFNQTTFYKSLSIGSAFLTIFIVIIWYSVIALNEIWQITNNKTVTIKRFLGYKHRHKYFSLYLILGCLNSLVILTGISVKSIFLASGFLLIWLLEILLLNQHIKRLEKQLINQLMKA